jgi:hypothetical protein
MSNQRTIVICEGEAPKLENELRRITTFEDGFNIQYVSNERQEPNKLISMKHGRVNEKNVIKNADYQQTVQDLKTTYPEYLSHIVPSRILFLEDDAWEQTEKTNNNSRWKIDIKKASKDLREFIGYDYVINTRTYFIDKWSAAQVIAAIMEKLLRINPENGSITKYNVDDKMLMVATLGAGFLDKGSNIVNIIENKVEFKELRDASGQIKIFDMDTLPDAQEPEEEFEEFESPDDLNEAISEE